MIRKAFFYLPVVNLLFDIFFVFEPLRPFLVPLRVLTLIFICVYCIFFKSRKFFSSLLQLFPLLTYFLILTLLSSNVGKSINGYGKFALTLLMYPAYYAIISDLSDIKHIMRSILITSVFFSLNFVLSQLSNLGRSVYTGGDEFMSGNLTASALYTGSICILILMYVLNRTESKPQKTFIIIVMVSAIVLLLLSLRRTAILAVIIGFVFLFLIARRKRDFIKYLLIIVLFLIVSFPLYSTLLNFRYQSRAQHFEDGALMREGRFLATEIIWTNILSFEDIQYSLMGKELFNSAGNYGYPNSVRLIHSDINMILSGSGLLGLGLYFMFYLTLGLQMFRFNRNKYIVYKYGILTALGLTLIIVSLIISFSSGLLAMTYRSTLFYLLGGLTGIFKLEQKLFINAQRNYYEDN